jgi:hypothetical protein
MVSKLQLQRREKCPHTPVHHQELELQKMLSATKKSVEYIKYHMTDSILQIK